MLLAIDVGNTNIVLGVFDDENLRTHFRLSTSRSRTVDEYGLQIIALLRTQDIRPPDIHDVIISTVVPPITDTLAETAKKYFNTEALFVDPGIKIGLNIKYENPKEVGADRIVNAVAALAIYGGPIIVVDFGTATTFCAINEKAEYLGGAIAPGIGISMEALFRAAAKLPRVQFKRPERIIGKNTVESMQSGMFYSFVSQVDGMVTRMKKELGEHTRVVATGGIATLIAPDSKTIDHVSPLLTLEGLRIIYEKNKA
jgi:type III pantothenate kinase